MDKLEVAKEIYSIDSYDDWDQKIFESAQAFKEKHKIWPNILLGNSGTLKAFDLFMSRKLLKEGEITKVTSIGTFECNDFQLQICSDEELPEHTFALVYDEEAEFDEEEPEKEEKLKEAKRGNTLVL